MIGASTSSPAGLRLVFRPPYSREPQPAERRWPFAYEAAANRSFAISAEFDRALAARRLAPGDRPALPKPHTHFHRWP